MGDGPSIDVTGPRVAWMPTCVCCGRPVDGLVVWDTDPHAKVYEAQCHGERDELRIPWSDIAAVPARDVEFWLRNRVDEWQPFGN